MDDKPLDLTKPVQLRDGTPATLLPNRLRGDYPLVVITHQLDHDIIQRHSIDGGHWSSVGSPKFDLINVPEPSREWFVSVFRGPNRHPLLGVLSETPAKATAGPYIYIQPGNFIPTEVIARIRITEGQMDWTP